MISIMKSPNNYKNTLYGSNNAQHAAEFEFLSVSNFSRIKKTKRKSIIV